MCAKIYAIFLPCGSIGGFAQSTLSVVATKSHERHRTGRIINIMIIIETRVHEHDQLAGLLMNLYADIIIIIIPRCVYARLCDATRLTACVFVHGR